MLTPAISRIAELRSSTQGDASAACAGAPMMMVDHVYHEHLTPESIDKTLDELT